MATLYVKDVPEPLYKALKERARKAGRSVSAEVRKLLEDTVADQRSREEAIAAIHRMRERFARTGKVPFDVEQSIRDDRDR